MKSQVILHLQLSFRSCINQDSTAVFADDNFFSLFDLALFLRRNSVKTSTTGISHNRHNTKSIAVILTDTVIRKQQSFVNFFACFLESLLKCFSSFSVALMIFSSSSFLTFQHCFFCGHILSLPFPANCFFSNFFAGVLDVFFSTA